MLLGPARLILATGFACLLAAAEPSARGAQLALRYDAMDVEHHWLPGRHVDWSTGDPDNGRTGKTHCSAFAAAACERLGIYLLRPPEHGQKGLANAQFHWLRDKGPAHGWVSAGSPLEAQRLANDGWAVLCVFLNPDPRKPGHIALVRPSDKSEADLQREGPQIIQAGGTNYASTSVQRGFRQHPGAWVDARRFQVRFYAHAVEPGQ